MPEKRTYPNRLGLNGWVFGGRWGVERYLFILHRLTGLGLITYLLMHIVVTASRALGAEWWDRSIGAVTGPIFTFGEFLVVAGFAFHAANGLRLVLIEMGWLTGKAEEPIYPYKTSLNVQRPFMIVMMALAAVLIVMGGVDIFAAH